MSLQLKTDRPMYVSKISDSSEMNTETIKGTSLRLKWAVNKEGFCSIVEFYLPYGRIQVLDSLMLFSYLTKLEKIKRIQIITSKLAEI